MLITKPMPAATFSLYDPFDGGWAYVTDPQRLVDGRPREKCRISAGESGDPELPPVIQIDFAEPYSPRLFGVVARSGDYASSETAFAVSGRAVGSETFSVDFVPGGTAAYYRLPDGTLTALFVSSFTTEIDALRIFYGSVDDTFIDIGQTIANEVFEFRATREWSETRQDLRKLNTTQSGQPYPAGVNVSARSASVTVAPVGFSSTIAGGDSLQALQASLAGYRPVCCVPMPRGIGRGDSAAIDQEAVTRSALFGWCESLGTIQIVQGSNLFQLPLRFKEAPG